LKADGLPAFREQVGLTVPFLSDRTGELTGWSDIKLLTVRLNRLRRWFVPGLLCIGDAAHAMSPIGGVGINLAIQDAIAAANILASDLRAGPPGESALRAVQRRREWPAKTTQRLQAFIQRQIIGRVLTEGRSPLLRWIPAIARALPFLPQIPGRLVGLGFRPEHVRVPRLRDDRS
jgi:2-polyprenyl-6-methoxyphenol hydroxylase-like FAD-dependent oxidoreductase